MENLSIIPLPNCVVIEWTGKLNATQDENVSAKTTTAEEEEEKVFLSSAILNVKVNLSKLRRPFDAKRFIQEHCGEGEKKKSGSATDKKGGESSSVASPTASTADLFDMSKGLDVRFTAVRPMRGLAEGGVGEEPRKRYVAFVPHVPFGASVRIQWKQHYPLLGGDTTASVTKSHKTATAALSSSSSTNFIDTVETPRGPFTVDLPNLVMEDYFSRLGSAFTVLARMAARDDDWLLALQPYDTRAVAMTMITTTDADKDEKDTTTIATTKSKTPQPSSAAASSSSRPTATTNAVAASPELKALARFFYGLFYHGLFTLPFSERSGAPILHLPNMVGRYCIDLSGCCTATTAVATTATDTTAAPVMTSAASTTEKSAGEENSISSGAKSAPEPPSTTGNTAETHRSPSLSPSSPPPSLWTPIRWDRDRKLRKCLGQFRLTVNRNSFKSNLDRCAAYHEAEHDSTWITPWHSTVLDYMHRSEKVRSAIKKKMKANAKGGNSGLSVEEEKEKEDERLKLYAFELWDDGTYKDGDLKAKQNPNKNEKGKEDDESNGEEKNRWANPRLCAITFGFGLGSLFHDFTMCTLVRDDRGAGTLLTKVVGDLLQRCGYKLWYWGSRVEYMQAFESKRKVKTVTSQHHSMTKKVHENNKEEEEREKNTTRSENEKAEEHETKRETEQQRTVTTCVTAGSSGYGASAIDRSLFYDIWEQFRDVPPTPLSPPPPPQVQTNVTKSGGEEADEERDNIKSFIYCGQALVKPLMM